MEIKLGFFFLVSFYILQEFNTVECKSCKDYADELNKMCSTSNYEEYVACVRSKRSKRSVDCDGDCDGDNCGNSCGDCDCDSCGSDSCEGSVCESNCCSSCCQNDYNFNHCKTNHCCHKMCHSECRSTNCRRNCRKSCQKIIYQTPNNTQTAEEYKLHNVTTVIHLKNNINHTYVIDVPINMNYTNQNNVSLSQIEENREEINNVAQIVKEPQTVDEKCCVVIGPRQCSPSKEYPFYKCFHTRSKQCGSFCSADIVHEERRQICSQVAVGEVPQCQQQNIYIPQPQPKCVYQSAWPYVSCGIQKPASCEGCYSQLGVQDKTNMKSSCSLQCFDDGFGLGSYYRKGPFYQPGYQPYPPCQALPQGCGNMGGFGQMGYPYLPQGSQYYAMPQPFQPLGNGEISVFSPEISLGPVSAPLPNLDVPQNDIEIDVDVQDKDSDDHLYENTEEPSVN